MFDGPFALAAAAGMAATVNPCGFALLPAYLARFVGQDHDPGVGAVPRAFAVSAALTAGFVVVFGLFGAVISPLAASVEKYLPWVTIVIGVALVGLGVALLAGRQLTVHLPKLERGGRDGSLASMFLFGVSYAVASLSCTIGPFLAVTSSTFGSGDVVSGIGVFVVYALGMGVVVTALTVGVALARAGLAGRLRSALPYVSRFSGALLVVAGAYVAWYGGSRSARSPEVTVATRSSIAPSTSRPGCRTPSCPTMPSARWRARRRSWAPSRRWCGGPAVAPPAPADRRPAATPRRWSSTGGGAAAPVRRSGAGWVGPGSPPWSGTSGPTPKQPRSCAAMPGATRRCPPWPSATP